MKDNTAGILIICIKVLAMVMILMFLKSVDTAEQLAPYFMEDPVGLGSVWR